MFRRSTRTTNMALATSEPEPESEVGLALVTVTDRTFLDDTGGEVALVDFWAPWCGPCRSFTPMFHEVAVDRGKDGFRFGSCNVDENPQTAALLGIQTIPTIVAFDPAGNELARLMGVPSRRELDALVQQTEAARP